MLINEDFFSKRVLLFNEDLNSRSQVFDLIAKRLRDKDVVKSTFEAAIEKREQNYPTGLNLGNGIGVAIPHTDPEHVNENQIAFISLKNPVEFRQMGSETEKVPVKLVFVLCLKEAHKQLKMLQDLMQLFGDEKIIKRFLDCKNESDFINIINSK
ncbi:PTS sugar transporter subunit IIA [Companilactobacillus futsaii]|jgi:PTS system galactitol-specific IIA component|uniref:PTS sugar transporter subunit IIA n=1 Tax=Companilactobacillus futsaii TaxID=938155 RepID=UPI00189ECF1C|nr:PTS sugar transporter subunit IIA [Companilactobacillus futsaii]